MEHPQRKHPRLKTYDYSQNGVYFLTLCTKDRKPLLSSLQCREVPDADALGMQQVRLSAIGRLCQQRLEDISNHYNGVYLEDYVIMPDHVHVLLVLEDSGGQGSGRPTVAQIVHAFKRMTSSQAGKTLWQASFYDRVVRSEAERREIRKYISENPWKKLIRESP